MADRTGVLIKDLRKKRGKTLEQLKEATGLSIGFLSQLERGLSSIAVTSLEKIAGALDVDISYFLRPPARQPKTIVRSYERELLQVDNLSWITSYLLNSDLRGKSIFPRIVELLPDGRGPEKLSRYSHEGEEFIHVLEGVLTLSLEEGDFRLYPEDSAHFLSSEPHSVANFSPRRVVYLSMQIPNPFRDKPEDVS